MKLYGSPSSPFVRKCRVVAHELGLTLYIVHINPIGNAELRGHNPLGKVPALVTADGTAIYDSRVICEHLNEIAGGPLFPAKGRIRSLTLQALADGIADGAVARIFESRRAPQLQDPTTITRYTLAMTAGIDELERQLPTFAETPTIGEVATACALSYVDFRYGELGWKASHPKLTAWFERFSERPSMQATALENLA